MNFWGHRRENLFTGGMCPSFDRPCKQHGIPVKTFQTYYQRVVLKLKLEIWTS